MYDASDHQLLRTKAARRFGEHHPDALFDSLPAEHQQRLRAALDPRHGEPIAAFYATEQTWTVLTASHVVWRQSGDTCELRLGELRPGYEVGGDSEEWSKATLNWVQFPGCNARIWTPSASHLSMLLNVLQIVLRKNVTLRPE